ncbi:MAG: acetate--CoA ligase family protein [Candidatus Moraniibacteriota bacterium]
MVLSGDNAFEEAQTLLGQNGVSCFRYAENASAAFGSALRIAEFQKPENLAETFFDLNTDKKAVQKILEDKPLGERLSEDDARQVLEAYGFRFPQTVLAQTLDAALRAAESFTGPFALKIVSTRYRPQVRRGRRSTGSDS